MEKWINDIDFEKNLENKLIIVSTGGVSSNYFNKLLNISYPNTTVNNRPLKGTIAHYPYPPNIILDKILYIYGDVYNAMLSQIPKHYDNPSKLCNNKKYPHFYNIEKLLDYKKEDPFNIQQQIFNFMEKKVNYPIILLKYGISKEFIPILFTILENENIKKYEFKKRDSNFNNLNQTIKEKFKKTYGFLNNIVKNTPELIIRFPTNNYQLSQNDVIKYITYNKLSNMRVKHYKKINNFEIYNERDVNKKYGRIIIKKDNKVNIMDFRKYVNINCDFGGVEDPRYFIFNNKTFILMNGFDYSKKRNMYYYIIEDNIFVKLWINNFDISKISQQKNWTPYIFNNSLYFIYSFNELCILKLVNIKTGETNCIKGNPLKYNNNYKYYGSTPLIPWNYPYYIGFVHTRSPWRSVGIIYDVKDMSVKKFGNIINFKNPKDILAWRGKSVQFPYDLSICKNNIILSVDFEDKCPTEIYLNYINFCKHFSI
jgi:hypothetical protein